MDIEIHPGRLSGSVRAIPSKSQAHRALICASLADGPTAIRCESESDDIAATADCMRALGADIRRMADGYSVRPLTREDRAVSGGLPGAAGVPASSPMADNATLPCGESGSTLRFLLPIVCVLGRSASFVMKGRLSKRPLSPLDELLAAHGCTLSLEDGLLHISGQLTPGRYALDAGVSSQFVSGLLFALPLLGGDSELRLVGQAESFPYIRLTLEMLRRFGVEIKFQDGIFYIPGGPSRAALRRETRGDGASAKGNSSVPFTSPGEVYIEGDWSNAAFWLCAGAVNADGTGGVMCTGLDTASRQGDRAVLDILKQFGCRIETDGSGAVAFGGKLRGIEIDARDIPDLVPILSVVGAAAEGITVIRNAGRLRTKESDRLAAVTDVLRTLGADITETDDGLCIHGGALTGGEVSSSVSSWGDHRIAMTAAIAATICARPVIIRGAEAVNKSYPGFFNDLRALGGSAYTMP